MVLLDKIDSLNMQYTRIAQSTVVAMIGPQNVYYETRDSLSVQDLVSQTVLTPPGRLSYGQRACLSRTLYGSNIVSRDQSSVKIEPCITFFGEYKAYVK